MLPKGSTGCDCGASAEADLIARYDASVEPEDWGRMSEEERAAYIGVPPYPYTEEDLMDTSHPGHPSNYGDR